MTPHGQLDTGKSGMTFRKTFRSQMVVEPAPIQRLPREIIETIFKVCVDELEWPYVDHTAAPILLTRISSGLRHIALTSPFLWSRFAFGVSHNRYHRPMHFLLRPSNTRERRSEELQVEALEEWIRRSGVQPLTFRVNFSASYSMRKLSQVLWSYSSRWKDVSLIMEYSILETKFFLKAADRYPLLSALHITSDIVTKPGIASSCMLKAPSLRKLSLDGFANPVDYDVDWSRLTHLFMDVSQSLNKNTGLQYLASILRQNISLVDLELVMGTYTRIGDDTSILLPRLKSLKVRNKYAAVIMLDRQSLIPLIRAPQLESLDASTILPGIEGFLERCPLLRKLAICCNPGEINTIFTYIQHLPLLEELRIVPRMGGSVLASGLPEALLSEQDGAVLCPNLRKLQLNHVMEISMEELSQFLRLILLGTSLVSCRTIEMTVDVMDWTMDGQQHLDKLLDSVKHRGNCGVEVILHTMLNAIF